MPLYLFYTMMQKVKNDQKLKSRGFCLNFSFPPQPIRAWTSCYISFEYHFIDFILKSPSVLALDLYDTNI